MGGGKLGVSWLELLEEMVLVAGAFVGGRGSDMVVLQIGGGGRVEVVGRKVMSRMHALGGVDYEFLSREGLTILSRPPRT